MKRQKLWRFISVMLSFLIAFGVINVPKYSGREAEASSVEYNIYFEDALYYYDVNDYTESSPATITVEIWPALDENLYEFKLSGEKTNGLSWVSGEIESDDNILL